MKINIIDAGESKTASTGYGVMSLEIGNNLKSLGYEISYNDQIHDTTLWIRPPHYLKENFHKDKRNIIFTMHETETLTDWKSDWATLLNKCNDVIVPTEWNRGTFLKLGVTVPIHVAPLGVNQKIYTGNKTYKFSILTVHEGAGRLSSRENWKDTIDAYYEAFYDIFKDEVQLTIKTNKADIKKFNEYADKLKDMSKAPPIDVIDYRITPDMMNYMYSRHWLFVKNANREGWCLPLLEAMSCNLPIAHTDLPVLQWTEKYKRRHVFPVGDIKALKAIMLQEHNLWRKQRGYINSLSWKNTAKEVHNVIKKD